MDILNKPISSFNFDDIVAFCKEGHIEGVQLDYKKEIPRDLAKHFAAFSNTRGGVIIIGVEENSKNSTPRAWSGVDNEGKLTDRVHQFAVNVEPLPSYEVHITDEKRGKVFSLIRIFEGDRTPYYVQNDANLWVRTGNISNPIGIASPDAAELLFKKSERASVVRGIYVSRTHTVFSAALKRANDERMLAIAREREEFKNKKERGEIPQDSKFNTSYYNKGLGTEASICTTLLQPHYPRRALLSPQDIKAKLNDIKARGRFSGDFPSLNVETIPEGVLYFEWRERSGSIECEQIYAQGLIYNSADVLRVDENGMKKIWLSNIAANLFLTLKASDNFYKLVGYQGGLDGYVLLQNVEGVLLMLIVPERWSLSPLYVRDSREALLSKYRLDMELDTALLGDEKELQAFFVEKINELYVGFGYEPPKEDLIEAFLKQEGWLVGE